MAHAFYRKWRPSTFEEVVGQEHVTQTLINAVRSSRIVHAYLFSGPRGTGKTSTARILAKAVNCLAERDERPCAKCAMCQAIDEGRSIDLIEIDAASHTGVDSIRDLRDKISFAPSEARFKFYIIDEVHMLSPAAFNALLKTLEEPPPHAILVLATTEPHKIPGTVLSRCQRFDFRLIPLTAMVNRLRDIASAEGLTVSEAALDLIARQATGSMRDAESLLDQLASYGDSEIALLQVQTMLGLATSQAVKELVDHLAARDVAAGLSKIGHAVADGVDTRQLSRDLLSYLRGLLLMKTTDHGPANMTDEQQNELARQAEHFSIDRLVRTIKLFSQAGLDIKGSAQPQLPLELSFVEAVLSDTPEDVSTPITSTEPAKGPRKIAEQKSVFAPDATATDKPAHQTTGEERSPDESTVENRPRQDPGSCDEALVRLLDKWSEVVASINRSNRNLAAVVRDCPPVALDENLVTLCARSHFHKQQLESDQAKELIGEAIGALVDRRCRIRCVLTPDTPTQSAREDDLKKLTEDPVIRAGLELGGEIGAVQ